MLAQRSLGLEDAQRAINAVLDYATSRNWRIAVVVVDRTGELSAASTGGTSDWDFAEVAFRALGPGFSHSDVMHQDRPVHVDAV